MVPLIILMKLSRFAAAYTPPDFNALQFPSGVPVSISNSAVGDSVKVPHPPIVYQWTDAIAKMSSSGIVDLPVAPEIGSNWAYTAGTDLVNCPAGEWVLSYDDGPSDFTPQLLNILKSNSVPVATFFTIGANVVAKPIWASNLRAVFDAGHQISLHSWTHRRSTNLTTDEFISEVIWNALAVKQVTGKIPRYFRPPYGDTDDRIRSILAAMGLKQMIWNVLPNDSGVALGTWNISQAVGVFQSVLNSGLRNTPLSYLPDTKGYISLEHELHAEELNITAAVIPMIKAKNFNFVSAATCVSGSDTDSDRYLQDNEPFAQFLNSIKLPFDVNAANAQWLAVHSTAAASQSVPSGSGTDNKGVASAATASVSATSSTRGSSSARSVINDLGHVLAGQVALFFAIIFGGVVIYQLY